MDRSFAALQVLQTAGTEKAGFAEYYLLVPYSYLPLMVENTLDAHE
jgi:hypothetical protein